MEQAKSSQWSMCLAPWSNPGACTSETMLLPWPSPVSSSLHILMPATTTGAHAHTNTHTHTHRHRCVSTWSCAGETGPGRNNCAVLRWSKVSPLVVIIIITLVIIVTTTNYQYYNYTAGLPALSLMQTGGGTRTVLLDRCRILCSCCRVHQQSLCG